MKRKALLEESLQEEKNVGAIVSKVLEADKKAIKRAKRDIRDGIETLQEELETRLQAQVPIDKAVIESTFASLVAAKQKLSLYKKFEKEFLSNEAEN